MTDVVLDVAAWPGSSGCSSSSGRRRRVVQPAELTGLAADAARRVLARYDG